MSSLEELITNSRQYTPKIGLLASEKSNGNLG